jgi:hypothetical protein
MHNLRVTTLAEVNHFVIKQYKAFVSSEIGKARGTRMQWHLRLVPVCRGTTSHYSWCVTACFKS